MLAVPATLTPANRRAASRGRAASLAAGSPLFAYRHGRRPIGARARGWQQGTLRAQVDEADWGTLSPIGDASRLSGGRGWPWPVPRPPDGGANIRFCLGSLCSLQLITTERRETEELRSLYLTRQTFPYIFPAGISPDLVVEPKAGCPIRKLQRGSSAVDCGVVLAGNRKLMLGCSEACCCHGNARLLSSSGPLVGTALGSRS